MVTKQAPDKKMSLLDHLEELRWALIRGICAVVVCAIPCGIFWRRIFEVIAVWPLKQSDPAPQIIYTAPAETIMFSIKIALTGGVIIASPYIFMELWKFISPALYKKEKAIIIPAAIASTFCFLSGITFCYFLLPMLLQFLTGFAGDQITPLFKINEYFSFIIKISLAFGLAFELPVVAFVLTKMGVIDHKFLIRYARHSIVGIFIAAAVLTPPDLLSQILLAVPLLVLYGLSILIALWAKPIAPSFYHKKASLLLIALLISAFWNGASAEMPPYASYRDIPGVTEAEIAAVEALREQFKESGLIYGMMESAEAFVGQDGEVHGFAALVSGHLSELFGITFKPALYEWGDMIAGLKSGEVHFSGDLTPTEKRREEGYFMTEAFTNRSIVYFRLEKSQPLSVITTKRELRYGFFESATTADAVLEFAVERFEAHFVTEFSEAYDMLKDGSIDAFFEESPTRAIFDAYGDVVCEVFLPLIYEPISLTTQTPELAPIIAIVDKYLQNGGLRHFVNLYKIGERKYAINRVLSSLTEEEIAFVNSRPTVLLAAEYDNYPISFYNANEKQWQGIAIDALREVEALTGITFEIANDPGVGFQDLLKKVENGDVSMITELIRSNNRRGKFLWPETPLLSSKYALITKANRPLISISEVLNMKVGVQKGTAYAELFHRWFPNHPNTVDFYSNPELFDALEKDEIDAVMASHNLLLTVTNYMERPSYKANVLFEYAFESPIGFNIRDTILCSVVDKALKHINLQGITNAWLHKTYDYRVKLAQSRIPLMIGVSVLLLCVVVLLLTLFYKSRTMGRRMEKLVEKRTEELGDALEAARSASRAKSAFLANMTHEIRTPMNSINGFAELISDYDIPDKPKEYVDKIMENSRWLLQIVNDILDVSKIEAGKATLENVPFDLHVIFARCQATTIQKAVEKGLVLHTYTEPFVGKKLIGDPTKLCQIFINLISNAIKFTNIGAIKVSAAVIDTDEDAVTIHFEVRDSGIGMTAEEIARVAEPFVQADDSVTRKYGGTGLGLAIIKNYVEMMGGKLNVESSPGIGSKFSFDLTFNTVDTDEDDSAKIVEVDVIEKPMFDGEVLICEDNRMNQEVIRKHLERIGLRTVIAENGKAGLEMFKSRMDSGEKMFDLVLMDIYMPIMDGLEAAQKIIELNADIPVIAMTANVMPIDMETYKKCGMNDCIGKPFTSQELWQCLLKYLKSNKTSPLRDDDEFTEFLIIFAEDNKNKLAEFTDALNGGDVKSALRIAHTLKSNAGTIGKQALRDAAEAAESALVNGVNTLTWEQLNTLEHELNAVLRSLAPLLEKNITE